MERLRKWVPVPQLLVHLLQADQDKRKKETQGKLRTALKSTAARRLRSYWSSPEAVKSYPDAALIPSRNKERLRALGEDACAEALQACLGPAGG